MPPFQVLIAAEIVELKIQTLGISNVFVNVKIYMSSHVLCIQHCPGEALEVVEPRPR